MICLPYYHFVRLAVDDYHIEALGERFARLPLGYVDTLVQRTATGVDLCTCTTVGLDIEHSLVSPYADRSSFKLGLCLIYLIL